MCLFGCIDINLDIKKTLVSMSERTGLSISQVTDEVLYTGLVEMQVRGRGGHTAATPKYMRLRPSKTVPKGEN